MNRTGSSLRFSLLRVAPVLLPLAIIVVTGIQGLDFGNHWDEKGYQLAPLKTMLSLRAPLPGHYGYPSFDYWVSSAALLPDIVTVWGESTDRRSKLQAVVGSQSFLLRVRGVFLVIAAMSILWVYLLVLKWRASWQEALLAACFFAFSWEVAYHIRWIATDGILMQFGALTLLCTMVAYLNPDGARWLYLAAGTAGLGMGTKYPGGLLLVPVMVAGFLRYKDLACNRLILRLSVFFGIALVIFLISTPAVILRPVEVLRGILYEVRHYASGHAGHTVSPGAEHGWRMLVYLSTSVFSHFPIIALIVFGLSLIGGIALIREDRAMATVVLSFPLLYFIYFSIQRAMVARNLLVLVPFLAVLAARGVGTVWKWTLAIPSLERRASGFARGILCAGVIMTLSVNIGWLVYAAGTIVDRHSDRFAGNAIKHIEQEYWNRFYLSPFVRVHLEQLAQDMPTNVTPEAGAADRILLYASEGLPHWQDWPANRPDLTERWFGPYEVNFNIYPNWWGDDRIIEMTSQRAAELGILPCCKARQIRFSAPPAHSGVRVREARSSLIPSTWAIPDVDPCVLVSRTEAEAVMGPLREEPRPGGTAADGTACMYVAERSIVSTVGIISTRSFDDRSSESGNIPLSTTSHEMFLVRSNAFQDVRLLARGRDVALMIHVAARGSSDTERAAIARFLATTALDHLTGISS